MTYRLLPPMRKRWKADGLKTDGFCMQKAGEYGFTGYAIESDLF